MSDLTKKNNSGAARRRIIIRMIDACQSLSAKLGRHPLTKGCNCLACIHQRKRLLEINGRNWKYKL
jgi:hypothetical protein